jgi:hypothetical protein
MNHVHRFDLKRSTQVYVNVLVMPNAAQPSVRKLSVMFVSHFLESLNFLQ